MNAPFNTALARAEGYLARFRGGTVGHFIDGKADAGTGATFESLCPVAVDTGCPPSRA